MEITPIKPIGIEIAQKWEQLRAILEFIDENDVELFIELGVWKGGIASLLTARTLLVPNFWYIGVDVNGMLHLNEHVMTFINSSPKANIILANVFDMETQMDLYRIIHTHNKVFLFCDNGDKPKEIRTYAPYLKSGDFIAVHDYNTEIFDEDLKYLFDLGYIELYPIMYRFGCNLPIFMKK